MEVGKVTSALFKLDDTEAPGLALVKVLGKQNDAQTAAVKAATGCDLYRDLYRIEVVRIVNPSNASMKTTAKPGQKKTVSAKHLIFLSEAKANLSMAEGE